MLCTCTRCTRCCIRVAGKGCCTPVKCCLGRCSPPRLAALCSLLQPLQGAPRCCPLLKTFHLPLAVTAPALPRARDPKGKVHGGGEGGEAQGMGAALFTGPGARCCQEGEGDVVASGVGVKGGEGGDKGRGSCGGRALRRGDVGGHPGREELDGSLVPEGEEGGKGRFLTQRGGGGCMGGGQGRSASASASTRASSSGGRGGGKEASVTCCCCCLALSCCCCRCCRRCSCCQGCSCRVRGPSRCACALPTPGFTPTPTAAAEIGNQCIHELPGPGGDAGSSSSSGRGGCTPPPSAHGKVMKGAVGEGE